MVGLNSITTSAVLSLVCGQVLGRQIPLQPSADPRPALVDASGVQRQARKLHGRFLQITDFHPDRFYEVYSSTSQDSACHRGSGPAGYYGAETSECDSPFSLINATFDWIKSELKDQIDFVVWTGDSARHDNDEEHPRTTDQVVSLNQYLVSKVTETWGRSDDDDDDPTNDLTIPVVPTFGNNDILPHNIFEKGPNRWTKAYLSIWKNFIPEEQRHQFDQGGWFSVEVIPNHLTVFSLNSLYFFDSNSAVDGCAAKSEPGYRQMEWLRIQLQYLRVRGMKAIIIGHVPPARTGNKQAWDETCWQKYALWMRQYRDVVTGSMYGHMNLDHFMLQDFDDIDKDIEKGYEMILNKKRGLPMDAEEPIEAKASGNYLIDLRETWTKLPQPPSKKKSKELDALRTIADMSDDARPEWEIEASLDADFGAEKKKKKKKGDNKKKKPKPKPKNPADYVEEIGGLFAERFAVSLSAPSVVPNYFPTIRVYEYNTTGLDAKSSDLQTRSSEADAEDWRDLLEEAALDDADGIEIEKKKKKKKTKKRKFTVPQPPSKAAPPGPAYSPQSLSLLRFTQYYANLTRINNDFDTKSEEDVDSGSWKEGKHKGKKPHDKDQKPHPKKFAYEVLYDTHTDDVYNMTDLTTKSYLDLAQRISMPKKGHKGKKGKGKSLESDAVADDLADTDDLDTLKKGHKKNNQAWLTFVRRAFVATVDEDEIEESFGR